MTPNEKVPLLAVVVAAAGADAAAVVVGTVPN